MWWGNDGSWGYGWWWPGIMVMAVFMVLCMVMMTRMMNRGMACCHGRWHNAQGDAAERMLANRLASGEIDVDGYERALDALRRTADSTRA